MKTVKLLEKDTGVSLCDLGVANDFLDKTSKAQATKRKYLSIYLSIENKRSSKLKRDTIKREQKTTKYLQSYI